MNKKVQTKTREQWIHIPLVDAQGIVDFLATYASYEQYFDYESNSSIKRLIAYLSGKILAEKRKETN